MQCRWIRQKIHLELDFVREDWAQAHGDLPVEFDVEAAIEEGEAPSIGADAEAAATALLEDLREQTQQEVKARTEKSVLRNDDWSAVPESYTQEELYGDEPCDAVASGDTSTPAVSGDARSSTDATGKPLVPPPEFGERIRDTDKEAGWIPGVFPTFLQNETGDPFRWVIKEPDLSLWGPHIMRSKGWHAQAHMTFMYWWMNMI